MTIFQAIKALAVVIATSLVIGSNPSWAQETGVLQGKVTFSETGAGVAGAVVLVIDTGAVTRTDRQGDFKIEGLPEGTYEVIAQREHFATHHQTITIESEQTNVSNFLLQLSPIHEEVTVTATPGKISTSFDSSR